MWLEPGELMPAPLAQIPLGAFDADFRLKISICQTFVVLRPVYSRQLVEKEIHSGNPPVPGNDEISTGVSRCLAWAALYPLDPPAIAHLLGLGYWLILE
jgi:hypothetical protein